MPKMGFKITKTAPQMPGKLSQNQIYHDCWDGHWLLQHTLLFFFDLREIFQYIDFFCNLNDCYCCYCNNVVGNPFWKRMSSNNNGVTYCEWFTVIEHWCAGVFCTVHLSMVFSLLYRLKIAVTYLNGKKVAWLLVALVLQPHYTDNIRKDIF